MTVVSAPVELLDPANVEAAERTARLHFEDKQNPGQCFRCRPRQTFECGPARWAATILALTQDT